MIFQNRQGENLNRKRLKIISQTADEIIVDIERADNVIVDGTPINAETLNQYFYDMNTLLETVARNSGTVIKIENLPQPLIEFKSDPQYQIDGKLTTDFTNLTNKNFLDNNDLIVVQDSTDNTMPKANNKLFWSSLKAQILDLTHPIGSIYISVDSANPSTFFGGTWVAWGSGRVPIAIGYNGESNYISAETVGGSENSIASHTHLQNAHSHVENIAMRNKTSSTGIGNDYGISSNAYHVVTSNGDNTVTRSTFGGGTAVGSTNSTTSLNQNSGTVGGNRMPYITCYMWKRTN